MRFTTVPAATSPSRHPSPSRYSRSWEATRAIRTHEMDMARTLAWVERNVAETRMSDPGIGRMVRAELVMDDARTLRERIETATGERIAALVVFTTGHGTRRGRAPNA